MIISISLFIIIYIVVEFDLINIKKNKAMRDSLINLSIEKYQNLTDKEQYYLYKQVKGNHLFNKKKYIKSLALDTSNTGIPIDTNEYRKTIDEDGININLIAIDDMLNGMCCTYLGVIFPNSLKLIIGIGVWIAGWAVISWIVSML